MLIAAFCIFVKKYKSELIIIGQGEKLNMLSRLIKQFKLENSVKLLGQKIEYCKIICKKSCFINN